jgi:hypothetical protein
VWIVSELGWGWIEVDIAGHRWERLNGDCVGFVQ